MTRGDEYFAGLFDGEGCVHITTKTVDRYERLVVQVGMTDERPIKALAERFGGAVRQYVLPSGRTRFTWSKNGKNAVEFLRAIRPHSLVKGEQIDSALVFVTLISKRGAHEQRSRIAADVKSMKAVA